jgi:hypothetical protein
LIARKQKLWNPFRQKKEPVTLVAIPCGEGSIKSSAMTIAETIITMNRKPGTDIARLSGISITPC